MIDQKTALVAVYLALVLFACALPFALLLEGAGSRRMYRIVSVALGGVLIIGAMALVAVRGLPGPMSPLILSLPLALPLVRRSPWSLLGGLTALPMLAGVTWWAPELVLSPVGAVMFVLIGVAAVALPLLLPDHKTLPVVPALAGLLVVGVPALLAAGVDAAPLPFFTMWHHWSVYVAPAQSLLAGAMPFRDFPIQYGMGPTLLIAGVCRQDCWQGTYWIVFACNVLYLLAMGGCAMLLARAAGRGITLLVLIAMVCAVLLWAGFPPDYLGPMVTPSVSGMRFLPLAALLSFILVAEDRKWRSDWGGHALWLLGLAWSPEAAFQVTLVWWPYLGLRHAQSIGASRITPVLYAILRAIVIGVIAVALGAALLALVFRLGFGEWASLKGFTVYIRNPPGLLPANPTGPIWIGLGALAVGAIALRRGNERQLRTGTVCLLALLGVGSYYLGRSHDNNVLNLFPFVVLCLAAAVATELPRMLAGFAAVVLAGMIAWPATFGLGSWHAAWEAGAAGEFGPDHFIERIRFRMADSRGLLERAMSDAHVADAGPALAWLRANGQTAPLWISDAMLLPYGPPGSIWTGMSDIGSFGTLPPEEVAWFVGNGARDLHRTGWILLDKTAPGPWPAVFLRFYSPVEEQTFGRLTLVRLAPK